MKVVQVVRGKKEQRLLKRGWRVLAEIYRLGYWDSVVMGK